VANHRNATAIGGLTFRKRQQFGLRRREPDMPQFLDRRVLTLPPSSPQIYVAESGSEARLTVSDIHREIITSDSRRLNDFNTESICVNQPRVTRTDSPAQDGGSLRSPGFSLGVTLMVPFFSPTQSFVGFPQVAAVHDFVLPLPNAAG